jgi:hypothetical protein
MLRRFFRWLIGPPEHAEPKPEPLESQFVVLRTRIDALESEWHDVLDKINRWAARQNAYKRRAVEKAMAEGQSTPDSGEIVGPSASQDPAARKAAIRQRVAQLHARG